MNPMAVAAIGLFCCGVLVGIVIGMIASTRLARFGEGCNEAAEETTEGI